MVPIALMVFETEVNNPIDSFGAMLCVSVIIATVLTITAFLICKKKFAGFSVGGLRQALFLLLAALAIMGCAMTLNNTLHPRRAVSARWLSRRTTTCELCFMTVRTVSA